MSDNETKPGAVRVRSNALMHAPFVFALITDKTAPVVTERKRYNTLLPRVKKCPLLSTDQISNETKPGAVRVISNALEHAPFVLALTTDMIAP